VKEALSKERDGNDCTLKKVSPVIRCNDSSIEAVDDVRIEIGHGGCSLVFLGEAMRSDWR
jgi:hypothetical protein